jgi:hypothetical protein
LRSKGWRRTNTGKSDFQIGNRQKTRKSVLSTKSDEEKNLKAGRSEEISQITNVIQI